MAGSRYFSADFHIHTPASSDYKDKDVKAEDIVDAALLQNLDVIAITDHNTVAWVDKVREAAKVSTLVIFPGVEITAQGGHILALFEPLTPREVIEDVLIEVGIERAQWGQEEALAKEFSSVLEVIRRRGGLSLAAHADGPKGFLTTNPQGQARIRIYMDQNLEGLELQTLEKKDLYVDGRVEGYDRAVPCIQGSDAHSLRGIGLQRTLLKMHRASLQGIRQALGEPQLRIRFPSEWSPTRYPYIRSLKVSKGYLGGINFEFNPNLNCLVGGAGSGKSTVIEFLRFVLDQVSSMDHISEDCYGKLRDLAQVGAAIEVAVVLESGEQLLVKRFFDDATNPMSVERISDGELLHNLNIRQLFPIYAYSQGEAINISRNALAQLELIDKHLNLNQYEDKVIQALGQLSSQSDGLTRLEAVTKDRASVEANIRTTQLQITGFKQELGSLQVVQESPVVTSHPMWITERDYFSDLVTSLQETREKIKEGFDYLDLPSVRVSLPTQDTPNRELLESTSRLASELEGTREKARIELLDRLTAIEREIVEMARTWKTAFEKHNHEFAAFQIPQGRARIQEITAQLENYGAVLRDRRAHLQRIDAAEKTLQKELKKRLELFDLIDDQRARIFALRKHKAKEFVERIGDAVGLKIVKDGNRDEYEQLVTELLKGSYASHDISKKITTSILPRKLAEYVREENVKTIGDLSQIGDKWAQVVIERAKAYPKSMYDIESAPLEDRLEISFKVGPGNYRPLEKLSTGQKATVIVLLTMVEGKYPIVFDQPEDALYTPFIYTEVVRTLRREKDQRQFILATHNPNISVGADLDLGIVLESTASQSAVKASGGMDDEATQKLMVLHLEGGPEAFLTRQRKYGLA